MNILVTGGAGFIGSNLVYTLLSQNHQVVSLDNYSTGKKENLSSCRGNSNFLEIKHDVIDCFIKTNKNNPIAEKWWEFDYDQIYHLACPASPVHYQKDPIKTLKTSIWGIENVIEFALTKKARLVFSSTSEVYGDPSEHPQKESYHGNVNPTGIRACYDEGKRVAETFCFDYHREKNLNVGVARIFNTYGVNMFPQDGRVVSNFIVQSLLGNDITVYGDGSQTRSFCYVDDMVSGLISMMNKPGVIGPINLGNPIEKTVKELAEIIIEMTDSSSSIIYKTLPPDDPVKRKPDICLAQRQLDWQPQIDLTEGIFRTIEYFKKIIRNNKKNNLESVYVNHWKKS